jgi:prephenate dehydrogenase
VSSALAANLAGAPDSVLELVGQGMRDTVRIAGGDPGLWTEIVMANAGPLAEQLSELAARLTGLSDALCRGTPEPLQVLLDEGQRGQRRIPGKHGGAARSFHAVSVLIRDARGELARLFADAAAAGLNIEDLQLDHAPGLPYGVIDLFVTPAVAPQLVAALTDRDWRVLQVRATR